MTDHLGGTDNATAVVLPEIAKVHQWLRADHLPTEVGLVHVVVPSEAAVVPWSLFTRKVPQQIPQQTKPIETAPREKSDDSRLGKSKRKTKTSKPEKVASVQLTILDGPHDDEASSASPLPKDK
jgi:hypothetical protein